MYTAFVTTREQIAGGTQLAKRMRDELLETGPWVIAGRELKYPAPAVVYQHDVDAIAAGLRKIAARVSAARLVGRDGTC